MATQQTAVRLGDSTRQKLDDLIAWGHGSQSEVIREAIERLWLAEWQRNNDQRDEPADMAGDPTWTLVATQYRRGVSYQVFRSKHGYYAFATTVDGERYNEGGYRSPEEAIEGAHILIDSAAK